MIRASSLTTLFLLTAFSTIVFACGDSGSGAIPPPAPPLLGDGGVPAPDGSALAASLTPCPIGQTPQNGACAVAPATGTCPPGQAIVNGACAVAPSGTGPAPGCVFDTHTVFMFQGRVVESITSHGHLFNFEADGSPWPTNGMDLTQVPYFAAGPCAGQAPGTCKLDTRTFALFPGNHLIEFVTAAGRSWAFENGTATDSGTDLATSQRYAEICQLRGPGPCTFDTRTFVNINDQLIEAITAYGRYFAFDRQGNRSRDNGADLAAVPRYAAGPCQGRTAGQCTFDTRTYGLAEGRTVEIVTANGRLWRYLAGEQSGFAEVQPSGVPSLDVATWKAACL
jgi:hypothetical protein